MVTMWSWGFLSAPCVGRMAESLYSDVLAAVSGDLDLEFVERFANINSGGERHALDRMKNFLAENGMPKMTMERIIMQNGLSTEDH